MDPYFNISQKCAESIARWLEGGFVLQQVYAAKNGGINFRNSENQRWHINNDGKMVKR